MKLPGLDTTIPGTVFGEQLPRRRFLKSLWGFGSAVGLLTLPDFNVWWGWMQKPTTRITSTDRTSELFRLAPAARYWTSWALEKLSRETCHEVPPESGSISPAHVQTTVKCLLCVQGCVIHEGERGGCGTRVNLNGTLRSLVYGRPISMHVDPIEKKPLFHFLPGSPAYSLATAGCPLHCQFCQNWELSQAKPEDYQPPYVAPEEIVTAAVTSKTGIIAFTYNEPTVFTEYLTDIARQAQPQGLRCVLISCGFMNAAPLEEMCSLLDAIKIDLKGFSDDFYRRVCQASLKPVLRSIKQVAGCGVHLEIVNLVVPTLNDSPGMLRELVKWIFGEIGPDVPVHFTRFHPDYRLLNLPPTPVATLERAYDAAREAGLHYPYVGNVPSHPGNSTYCPGCGKAVIVRSGFFILENQVVNGKCSFCQRPIAGTWT